MDIYLVGGAVRNKLLNQPIIERDWVIVGSSPDTLLQQGFIQVGNDFPVFLHPQTKEEYALARTERKSGKGYTGFICDFNPEITLEQDLLRRDLTINAIAQDEQGNLIDPFGGINDLNARILRHVSPAFREDPLRILRVARFAARFYHLGFTIASDTLNLMRTIVDDGEISHLTPERVWKETEKALATNNPQIYFSVLKDCNALAILYPEVNNLFGIPAPEKWHPEIDTGIHTLLSLEQAAKLTTEKEIRFSVLCHDFGKALTPKALWPHHKQHGESGIPLVKTLCHRQKIPNTYKSAALKICQFHDEIHIINKLPSKKIVQLFDSIDVWRNPHSLQQLLIASESDFKGRIGWENKSYPQASYTKQLYLVAKNISVKDVINDGFKHKEIQIELHKRRVQAVENWQLTNNTLF